MNYSELMTTLLERLPALHHTIELADLLGVHPGTLTSRFVRAGAPSPRQLIQTAVAVRVAEELEDGATMVGIARRLNFSSPQHVARFIRQTLDTTRETLATEHRTRRHAFVTLMHTHAEAIDRALASLPAKVTT